MPSQPPRRLHRRASPAALSPWARTASARAGQLCCLVIGLSAGLAQAQTATPAPQRVEITGSSIKRLDTETALPVQVLTREDIVKAGAVTAAEIVKLISATSKGLTDGVSISTGGYRDQTGFNSANLRGIGTSSTLVLLNGRRMANFASPGDDAGVDLNNIPAAAVDRVEVLLDGASAIYGTDAIGGVINFITRKDYTGVQLDAHAGKTQEGGAGRRGASLAAGFGTLEQQGFNILGVIDVQRTDALRTSQREFIGELKIPERLPHLLSSAGFPGNIRLTRDQRDYLQDIGFKINGKEIVNRTINLSAPACNPPHTLYLPAGIGGEDACTYDFMRDVELYPKSEKTSALGRGVFKLSADHQLFAEAAYAKSKTFYVATSNRVDGDVDVLKVPGLAGTGMDQALPDDRIITVRTRLLDAGNRTSELTSTGSRVVLGLSGQLAGWDYDTALNHSVNTVTDRDVRGYLLYDKAMDGFANGTINPFGPQSAAGLAYLESIQVSDTARRARGTMDQVDFKASRALAKLAGGDLALALGAELRRERATSSASDLLLSDNILGDPTPGDAQFTNNSRKVWAVFGELNAPITKTLELGLALRHDRYQTVGSTTNPKVNLRWTAAPSLLMRASAGTGFRAPSLTDLYRSVKTGVTAILPDPVCMAENDNDLGICALDWDTRTYANPKLKPERSRQFSLGMVFEPSRQWSVSVDYWAIQKRDLISTLGDDVILANLAKYEPLVHRYNEDEGLCDYDPDDSAICYIELRKENRGKQKAAGLDLTVQLKGLTTAVGTFGAKLAGTLTLTSKAQTGYGDPFVSNLGRFVTDGVVQRWRHNLTVDWSQGPWGVSIGNSFSSAYTDQNSAIDTDTGTVVKPNRVKAYSLWDIAAAWSPNDRLTVRGGVRNLFDTSPPFSNQAYHFLSGYDPSYTDPRGRSYFLSASYSFK